MGTRSATCDDCYFRQAGLCALPGNATCPTFRAAAGRLAPPPQPRLVLRPPPVARGAYAAHASA